MVKANKMRILVVCGTGIATSTAAENKLQTWLKKRGYNIATSQCIAAETNAKSKNFNPHIIVTTTKLKIVKEEVDGKTMNIIDGIPGIPAFNGVPFLTGVGEEALVDRICEALEATTKA
ncbi:MAG TPA: PTS sugar transporter subunit IIB [Anaerolineaceae bacterium]